MRQTITIYCLIALFTQAAAQTKSLMREDFDGSQSYFTTDTSSACCKKVVRKGIMNYRHTTNYVNWTYNPIKMSNNLDYVYEGTFHINNGSGYCGLFFSSATNSKDIYMFGVSTLGFAKVISYPGGNYKNLIIDKAKVKPGKPIRLKVLKQKNNFTFFINDKKFAELKNLKLHGKNFGFFASDNVDFDIDYLDFKQDFEPKPLKLAPNMPAEIVHTNLGPNVNSIYVEKAPVISADGKTIYFVVQNNPKNVGGKEDSDIYFSTQDENGKWSLRKSIGSPLNTGNHNSVISVLPDNNTLILGGVYKDGKTLRGMSMSKRTLTGDWGMPTDIIIKNHYNRNIYEERCISSSGKVMILAVERDDTHGDKDLYVSFLQNDGSWSEPENMGAVLNTDDSEISPFLAADGKTLYFSSYGHTGFGSADIFVSKRLDDSWKLWSEPENLGNQINTKNFDAYFTIPASGSFAYMVSNHKSIGDIDIVQLTLPEAIKPKPVVLVKGTVYNAKTKQPMEASITYKDLRSDVELGIANASAVDGKYQIVLEQDVLYSFLAERKDFISTSENIDTRNAKGYMELNRDLYLTPIEIGQTVRLNNVFFDVDKYELKSESNAELNRVIKLLKDNANMRIEVSGHTDATGNDMRNIALSENRAKAVAEYLINNGISANRIQSKGYGKTKPLATNDTEEGRQLNRRVQFTILGN
jgi:outer membrane protein OmpA-like peptidoglycan-associated protein